MDYENTSQEEKSAILEQTVLTGSPEEIAMLYRQLGQVDNTARALGVACRFGGLECVRALVGGGADFIYHKRADEYLFARHYWLTPLEMNGAMRMSYLIDQRDDCFTNTVTAGGRRFNVLPIEQRVEIVKYLYENREKVRFDADEMLYYAIMSGSKRIFQFLKESGVKFSQQRIRALTEDGRSYEWLEFCHMLDSLGDGEYLGVLERIAGELGGRRLHFTDSVYWGNYDSCHKQFRLYKPDIFRFILEHFNQKRMNKSRFMKGAINENSVACLEICAENGWLDTPRKRDEMIQYAAENGGTECQAWLLDFKNRTADFAAEREKAEKKMMRELNADPNSVTELKKVWGYEKCEDGTLVITRYKGSSTKVEVPEKIGGGVVTAIGGWAFSPSASRLKKEQMELRKSITRITLPKTVCAIGENAFYGCQALEQIKIPDSVTVVGKHAFGGCARLNSVGLSGSIVEIGEGAFWDCGSLSSVELPAGLTAINTYTFSVCQSLERVSIPKSVKVICKCAFYNCSALERVVIPEGVREIRQHAFSGCTGLKSVVLPPSVQKIQNYTRKGYTPETIFGKNTDVVVTVTPKSYAEKYCKRNKIQYVYAEGE